jgi:nucleoside-diphosphate-sugar epimerase
MRKPLIGQKVLLVGPGWLGSAAATTLAGAGASVWTLRRHAASTDGGHALAAAGGPVALEGDIRDCMAATPAPPWSALLPHELDHVIVCVAPSRHVGDSHENTYPAALRGAVAFARARRCRSLLYTSSTGVYGGTDGATMREDDLDLHDARPRDPRQRALLDAECAVLDADGDDRVRRFVLRVAGLYGPGRDPAARFGVRIPEGDDDVWCNFSWRDDVVSAIAHVITMASASGMRAVFNCADGMPLRASAIARALGAPQAHEDGAHAPSARQPRSNQRIAVTKLRETGWRPTMPTVLYGLEALGHRVRHDVASAIADANGE